MARALEQVLLLLAASGFSDRVLEEGLRDLSRLGPYAVVDEVQHLRRNVLGGGTGMQYSRRQSVKGSLLSESDQVVSSVIASLTKEAGLSASEVASRLTAMANDGPGVEVPAFKAKEGLRAWLKQLANTWGASQLLHYATRIRNDAVHSPDVDWPLRPRERG
jgi:hypothetical protein